MGEESVRIRWSKDDNSSNREQMEGVWRRVGILFLHIPNRNYRKRAQDENTDRRKGNSICRLDC
jgi:hypothetical protein